MKKLINRLVYFFFEKHIIALRVRANLPVLSPSQKLVQKLLQDEITNETKLE